jgi:hypothetical protein
MMKTFLCSVTRYLEYNENKVLVRRIPPHTLIKPHMRHSIQSLLKECGWFHINIEFLTADSEKTLLPPTLKSGLNAIERLTRVSNLEQG